MILFCVVSALILIYCSFELVDEFVENLFEVDEEVNSSRFIQVIPHLSAETYELVEDFEYMIIH